MVSWLDKQKLEMSENMHEQVYEINVKSLNENQRKAFDIISDHRANGREQLLMIITGLAGSGKSYLINNIRALLKELCVVTAFFGIAAFNVRGKTLHSLLNLPSRGKNQKDFLRVQHYYDCKKN